MDKLIKVVEKEQTVEEQIKAETDKQWYKGGMQNQAYMDPPPFESKVTFLPKLFKLLSGGSTGAHGDPLIQIFQKNEKFKDHILWLLSEWKQKYPEDLKQFNNADCGTCRLFYDLWDRIQAKENAEKAKENAEKEIEKMKLEILEKNEEMLDTALKASGYSSELQKKLDAYKASGGTKLTDKTEEEIKERKAKERLNAWYQTTEKVDYISLENDEERKEKLEKGKIFLFVGRDQKEGPANAPMKLMFNIQFGTGGAVKVGFMSREDAIGNKVEKLQGEAETTTEKELKRLIDDAASAETTIESANSMLYDAHMKAEMEGEKLKESNPWMQRAAFEFLQRQAYINLKEANTEQRMADYSKQERKDKCECGYILATSDNFCPSCGRSNESKEITIYRLVNGGKAI